MMKFVINNDIRVQNPTQEIIDYCKRELTLDNPTYEYAIKFGKYAGNIPKYLKLYAVVGDTYVLPFGCLQDMLVYLNKENTKVNFHEFQKISMVGNIKLYDYQENAKNRLKKGKNGILEAPCGSGKTQIGLQLIKEIGGRALWLTHTEKLLNQSMERAKLYFKGDFGTITKGEVNIGKDITFATVQTMSKIDVSLYRDAFDVVVVDECHHCVGNPTQVMQFYKIVTNCNCRYKFGLSATLERSDGLIKSVYAILGKKLYTITKEQVGDKIIKAKYVPVPISIDYPVISYIDYDGMLNFNKLIDTLSFNEARNKIIINNVLKQKGKQLLLCHRVEQVKYLSKELNATPIYGAVKDRNFNSDIIVATYQLAKEGLDIPDLQVLHLITPQKQRGIITQCAGRVERNINGKEQPIIYDYFDEKIPYCKKCQIIRQRLLK